MCARRALFLPTAKSSRRGNETRGEESHRGLDKRDSSRILSASNLHPRVDSPAAALVQERARRKTLKGRKRDEKFSISTPRHPSPRCTTGLPSDGSHDLIPANPSDGALRKLTTLVGQTTMCNRISHHTCPRVLNGHAVESGYHACKARIFVHGDASRERSILS